MQVGPYRVDRGRATLAVAAATTVAALWLAKMSLGRSAVDAAPIALAWAFLVALLLALSTERTDR